MDISNGSVNNPESIVADDAPSDVGQFAIGDIAAHARQIAHGNTVVIFDTTLRDGEQSPGATLNTQEKLEIAAQLARLGVDIMEVGFPAASPGDLDAVKQVAETVGRRPRRDTRRLLLRPLLLPRPSRRHHRLRKPRRRFRRPPSRRTSDLAPTTRRPPLRGPAGRGASSSTTPGSRPRSTKSSRRSTTAEPCGRRRHGVRTAMARSVMDSREEIR